MWRTTTTAVLTLSVVMVTGQWNVNMGNFGIPRADPAVRNVDSQSAAAGFVQSEPTAPPVGAADQDGARLNDLTGRVPNNPWLWTIPSGSGPGSRVSSFFPVGGAFVGPQQLAQSGMSVQNELGSAYYGTPVGTLNSYQHGVSGDVYAVDDETLLVKRFSFDGQVPDAYFYIGNTESVASQPFQGFILNNAKGQRIPLTRSDEQDVILKLSSGGNLRAYRWLAVISTSQNGNFGDVIFPRDFSPPTSVSLGPLMPPSSGYLSQSVRSGTVTVINDKQIQITNFYYDGLAPDAVFWTGQGAQPSAQGTIVPYQNSYSKLPAISGQSFTLTLPGNLNVQAVNWLAVWSRQLNMNLGYVMIPGGLNVPPTLAGLTESSPAAANSMDLPNCEIFGKGAIQVRWSINGQDLLIQLKSRIADNQYMAFGISGMQNRVAMIGSDVVVARWDPETDSISAHDYTLSARQECDGGAGVCPDTEIGGDESIQVIGGTKSDGVVSVSYRRRINTGDRLDLVVNPNSGTYVVWAIGPVNSRGQAGKHYPMTHATLELNERLNFGREPVDSCPPVFNGLPDPAIGPGYTAVTAKPYVKPSVWQKQYILGNETSIITAMIGPSGGRKGYTGSTGKPSWGLVWYLNGKLAPELILRRGDTYRFLVYGGMYPADQAKYHPLYITLDSSGGMGSKGPAEQAQDEHSVLAGVTKLSTGALRPTGVGQYCAFAQESSVDPDTFTSFEEYNRTLVLRCDGLQPSMMPMENSGEGGVLEWTPRPNDPANLYYQCFMHRDMGWKITLVNDYHEADAIIGQQRSQPVVLRPSGHNGDRLSGFYPPRQNQSSGTSRSTEVTATVLLFLIAFLLRK